MRKSHVVPMVAIAALSALPAMPASAAADTDTTAPQVQSITFDKSSVTVSGLATQLVGVRVRLTDVSGVVPYAGDVGENFALPFLRVTGSLNNTIPLTLAEGTAQDGIWVGNMPVTSAWSGKIEPVNVQAVDSSSARNRLSVDPRTVVETPALQVTSSHRPAVDVTFTPEPLPSGKAFVEHVRAWDTTTGKAWSGLPISLGDDIGCAEGLTAAVKTKTRSDGTYARTLSWAQRSVIHCAWVAGVSQPGVNAGTTVIANDSGYAKTKKFTVSVTAAASVKAGHNLNVTGSVSPVKTGKTIQLQRYISGRTWRTVGTAQVRASGRYTLIATPPGKATYQYRVYAPGDYNTVGSVSKTVKIRGL